MHCFYHNDMDGKCAAAIVRKYYDGKPVDITGRSYYPIDYKDEFPFEKITKDELVVIVDFSLQREGEFEKLLEITNDIIWIDHHKSAIEKHKHITTKVKGYQETCELAGCGLTWEYFYSGIDIPPVVRLLGDYDTWTFKYGDLSRYFQLGCRVEDTCPSSNVWLYWLTSGYWPSKEIENGKLISKFNRNENKSYLEGWVFFAKFEGYRVVCCNRGSTGSVLFDAIKPENYDIMSAFVWDGTQWTVSLYSESKDIDCAKLAEKYGGGGHHGAAGFQTKELPFTDIEV